jgi:hypothetical protein
MRTEVLFQKVKSFLKCVSVGVPGHIDHLHVMRANEVLRDHLRGKFLLGGCTQRGEDPHSSCNESVWGSSKLQRQGQVETEGGALPCCPWTGNA